MWGKVRSEIDTEKRGMKDKWFSALQHSKDKFFVYGKYLFLIAFLVFLASNEVVKPGMSSKALEYYNEEFRRGMTAFLSTDLPIDSCNEDQGLIKDFYKGRNFQPAWTSDFKPNRNFDILKNLISESHHYGLLPSSYSLQELNMILEEMNKELSLEEKQKARLLLEEKATFAALLFMEHIAAGIRENDTSADYQVFVTSLPAYLNESIYRNNLRKGILALQPKNPLYTRLQSALSSYLHKSFKDTGKYSESELVGDLHAISARLIQQGYLDQQLAKDSAAIISALNQFQRVHFLKESGKADRKTIKLLCQGTKERFYKIALNLDRLRKDNLESTNSILVNIPEYKLHYYNAAGHETEFNVMVGKVSSPTPLITSKLETIVTNPHWTVPRSITRNEILPKIKKDSTYLQRNGYTVINNANQPIDISSIDWQNIDEKEFKYWIRQTKINNALGVVKFMFPNDFSVYLHDTPSKSLFKKTLRAYSHGCVRVENPQELADILVANHTETNVDVKKMIKARERMDIPIEDSVSIYIRYYSCTADNEGVIYYHPDIYSKDEAAIEELFAQQSWN